MAAEVFHPWRPAADGRAGELPRRLTVTEAHAQLDASVAAGAPPIVRLGRLLELRRGLARTLLLNHESTEDGRVEGAELARAISGKLRRELEGGAPPDALAPWIAFEVELLDVELSDLDGSGGEAMAGPPRESADAAAGYAAWLIGRWQERKGDAAGAVAEFERALETAGDIAEARDTIELSRLSALYRAGEFRRCIGDGRALISRHAMAGTNVWLLGMAHHWCGRAFEREADWKECVEAARESNLQLFRFGASQRSRIIGINYYLVALGMAELEEWGEAAALAQLSLRALRFEARSPSRADGLFVLARCLQAFGGEKAQADARGVLTRLIEGRPEVADPGAFYERVAKVLEELGPGPVADQPKSK
jgi:tetratricopeptide (TPR) repeat protein